MKRNSPHVYLSHLILTVILCIGILVRCDSRDTGAVANFEELIFPDQEGWNSTVTSTQNGVVTAVIHYGHMQRFEKKKIVEFDQNVVVDFFNEKGAHTSKLTSEKGRLDEATNNIEAFGNVYVVSDTGITLTTERIWWDNRLAKIVSDEFVTITTAENDTINGTGFESDQNLENWVITEGRGRLSRGLDLEIELKNKKHSPDSLVADSTASPSQSKK
ncbi:MAG: LPS export ABC transporter periplasmic protein LptC [Candidatus Zhuqueibacterota bacterium]